MPVRPVLPSMSHTPRNCRRAHARQGKGIQRRAGHEALSTGCPRVRGPSLAPAPVGRRWTAPPSVIAALGAVGIGGGGFTGVMRSVPTPADRSARAPAVPRRCVQSCSPAPPRRCSSRAAPAPTPPSDCAGPRACPPPAARSAPPGGALARGQPDPRGELAPVGERLSIARRRHQRRGPLRPDAWERAQAPTCLVVACERLELRVEPLHPLIQAHQLLALLGEQRAHRPRQFVVRILNELRNPAQQGPNPPARTRTASRASGWPAPCVASAPESAPDAGAEHSAAAPS